MADPIDEDTLAFARLRARHSSARAVADDLLAAAADADRLGDISPTMARMCAADVLVGTGTPEDARDAIPIFQAAVEEAIPGESEMARTLLATALAETSGDTAAAETLAREFLAGTTATGPDVPSLLALSAAMGGAGYLSLSQRWIEAALSPSGSTATRGRTGQPDRRVRGMLEHHRDRIAELQRAMADGGLDPGSPAAVREFHDRRRAAGDTMATSAAWPALSSGRMVWWPAAEYNRLLRQVPDLAAVLASPWQAHLGRVQTALTGCARQGVAGITLVAANANQFAQFSEHFRVDPTVPAAMTAYTGDAAQKSAPVAWPPKKRAPCWCGSGRRYQDCCGA
jgi:SEC-C motif